MDRYGYRLTSRDQAIVCFVGRWNGVEARQIAKRFEMDEAHVYRRTGLLVSCGLIKYRRLLHGRPGGYTATRAAMDALRALLTDARRGQLPGSTPSGATFKDAAEEWLRYGEHDRKRRP